MSGLEWLIGPPGPPSEQALRNEQCGAQSLNMTNAALARRDTVTMNIPLKPWAEPISFHRMLALHLHNATRSAYRGSKDENYGLVEDEEMASKWDFDEKVGGR